jgi:RimJ/RimL family protein N-acetyltransferase
VTPALRNLFDPSDPQPQRCVAVLDDNAAGIILTDDPVQPTWGAVWEAGDGTLYLGGAPDAECVAQLIAQLRQQGDVLVGMDFDDRRWALLPAQPDYTGSTLDFDDRALDPAQMQEFQQLPPGHTICAVDRARLERSRWYPGLIRQYGSAERVLEKAFGSQLLQGDEICCEVFAGPVALGMIELSVETYEEYQRRGYATLTCAHAIAHCEALGLRTHWNCARQNEVSAALARKLGYRTEREYRLLAWFKT